MRAALWQCASFYGWCALGGCATASMPARQPPPDACRDAEGDVARVWGGEAKARIEAGFMPVGVEAGAKSFSRISFKLDQASADWARMRHQLCVDRETGRVSKAQYQARTSCLDDALVRMRAFTLMLQHVAASDVLAMTSAAERMSQSVSTCEQGAQSNASAQFAQSAAVPAEAASRAPAAAAPETPSATPTDPSAGGAGEAPAASPSDERGVEFAPRTPSRAERKHRVYGRSLAVVIGIDDYRELPDLRAAEADAIAVGQRLREAGFKLYTRLGKDATRERIVSLLGDELPHELKPDDRVFVFFAGHGVSVGDPGHKLGYLMPWAATLATPIASGISMTELQDWLGDYRAKHVMFVADACYSGLALPSRDASPPAVSEQALRMATREPVRFTLVAGQDNQQAFEMRGERRGAFTHFFLDAIDGAADANHDGLITASEVSAYVTDRVFSYVWQEHTREQRPTSAKSGRGEFIFFAPDNPRSFP